MDAASMIKAVMDRNDWSQRHIGDRMGHAGAGMVSRIITGQRPVPFECIEQWADALGLEGEERLAWRRAAILTNCPPEVAEMLDQADAKVAQLTSLVVGMLARECPTADQQELDALISLLGQPAFPEALQAFLLRHLGNRRSAAGRPGSGGGRA